MAERFQIQTPRAMMHTEPSDASECCNELLYGETVSVSESNSGDWIKVKADHDGYEGFIPATILGTPYDTQHTVIAPATHIYSQSDFKSPVLSPLFMGSRLSTTKTVQNGFREIRGGGWVFDHHLTLNGHANIDFVELALLFVGTPYLWGGRTVCGIDCSGLIQITLMTAGVDSMRDTTEQSQTTGEPLPGPQRKKLKRGDLVFFEGHVGLMINQEQVLNATSRHMQVVIETLDELAESYDGITGIRRIS